MLTQAPKIYNIKSIFSWYKSVRILLSRLVELKSGNMDISLTYLCLVNYGIHKRDLNFIASFPEKNLKKYIEIFEKICLCL